MAGFMSQGVEILWHWLTSGVAALAIENLGFAFAYQGNAFIIHAPKHLG